MAFSTPALLPSILMTVVPESVSGMMMITSVSDLILLMVEPPLPMMCLWYLASTLTSALAVSFTRTETWEGGMKMGKVEEEQERMYRKV